MRRCSSTLVVAVALTTLTAVPAAGKGPVRATVQGAVRCDAAPGTMIRIAWKLESLADGRVAPFGAGGVFVRLAGARGAPAVKAYGRSRGRGAGRYVARVRVPEGGIRRVRFGLDGWRIVGGKSTPAPMFFRVARPPCR